MKKRKASQVDRTTPQGKRIAIIWTRVSTKEQAENNLSLETQEKACRDYANKHGIEVEKLMGGTNESAKQEGKLYNEMISYVSSHKHINTILVYSFDRFSRAGAEAIVTKAFLKSKGISVISVTQPTDPDSTSGTFMENMIFIFNQFENNLRKEKCTAGMIECLERGDWYSKPPMGYEKDNASASKHSLRINAEGTLIAKAFRWKADEELSDMEVIERLKALGLLLSKQQLSNIFHNPFYCGKIRHHLLGDKIVNGNHPAITDEETFNKVNGIQTHSGYTHSAGTPEIPLKQHLICPECGNHMSGYKRVKKAIKTDTTWTFWYYKCNTPGCKLNKKADLVHERYKESLGQFAIPEEIQGMVKEQITKIMREKSASDMQLESELKGRETSLQETKRKTMVRFGSGEIPSEVYNVTIDSINNQIEEVESRLRECKIAASNLSIDIDAIVATACKLGTLWEKGDFSEKQKIQNLAFPEGVKWDREKNIPRTDVENGALAVFRSISNSYKMEKAQKKDKPCDLSFLVAGRGLEPLTSGL